MITIASEDHRLHAPKGEFSFGEFVPPYENPRRVDSILARIAETRLGPVRPPERFGADLIRRVHNAPLLGFLETAWTQWQAQFGPDAPPALPLSWPVGGMRAIEPEGITGKFAFFALDASTAITPTSWAAVRSAVDVALSAQKLVAGGERAAFALCRPPGHHATPDNYGGYCFVNNAAVAAEAFRQAGAARVAVLDVDYHHGNGTQAIFYRRPDVMFASLHASPETTYPYFSGYADEIGEGPGEGFNANYPLRHGTAWNAYGAALDHALARIEGYGPDALVISLGVDTFEKDPISHLKLRSEDYIRIGEAIARLKRPTLFVMEGGYAIEELGLNTVNLLQGFEAKVG
ncbi:acetylpolyamine amidohydrolase [Hypericibacter terrae]|jgi:acetoin utilization deacetylase AcuC-like enzyme|uniref:Acetylpolyamine amidohydrolase n=1 Tax=Hypericibacter terrae TaxID=2602015 RepID=A0A5J6MQL1_9PROT|nr:histone deacetylase family protein [Hypericibacter terrae]QEX19838.1 acetylpolyamine amidohydrolase [Hypericibacter terrae]